MEDRGDLGAPFSFLLCCAAFPRFSMEIGVQTPIDFGFPLNLSKISIFLTHSPLLGGPSIIFTLGLYWLFPSTGRAMYYFHGQLRASFVSYPEFSLSIACGKILLNP